MKNENHVWQRLTRRSIRFSVILGRGELRGANSSRLQRIDESKGEEFQDSRPSLAVSGVNGNDGAVFTFYAAPARGQKRRYGVAGGSYISVVEFGPRSAHSRSTPSAPAEIRRADTTWTRLHSMRAVSSNQPGSHSKTSAQISNPHTTLAKSEGNSRDDHTTVGVALRGHPFKYFDATGASVRPRCLTELHSLKAGQRAQNLARSVSPTPNAHSPRVSAPLHPTLSQRSMVARKDRQCQ